MGRRLAALALAWLAACACARGTDAADAVTAPPPAALAIRRLHMGDIGTLLLVPLVVDGHTSWWLLDTGATTNAVSREAALRWRLADRGAVDVAAAGGTRSLLRVALPPLDAAGLRWSGQTAVVIDLQSYFAPTGVTVDGVLGLPVLGAQPLVFDLQRNRLDLPLPADDAIAPPGRVALQLTIENGGLPTLELALGERAPQRFVFDTGNAGALVIFGDRIDAGLRKAIAETPPMAFDEIGGRVAAHHVSLERVSSAGFTQSRVPAAVLLGDAPVRGRQLARVAGAAGVALFTGRVFTLDLPRRRLLIEPADAAQQVPGGFGMALKSEAGSAVVSGLFAAGPAAAAGVAPGDRIVQIDGRAAPGVVSDLWAAIADRMEVRFGVERAGETRSVMLRRESFFPPVR